MGSEKTEVVTEAVTAEVSSLTKLKGYLGTETKTVTQITADLKSARADIINEGEMKAGGLRLVTEEDVKFNVRGQRLPYYVAATAVVAGGVGYAAATYFASSEVADSNVTPLAQAASNR